MLVEVILLEQNAEWAIQRTRYMTLEIIAPLKRKRAGTDTLDSPVIA